MELTEERAIELHRELWDWLYRNPAKKKMDWPRWEMNGGDIPYIKALCFPCEYTNQKCNKCLLVWPDNKWCPINGSIYSRWVNTLSDINRKSIAKIIRDLPERIK